MGGPVAVYFNFREKIGDVYFNQMQAVAAVRPDSLSKFLTRKHLAWRSQQDRQETEFVGGERALPDADSDTAGGQVQSYITDAEHRVVVCPGAFDERSYAIRRGLAPANCAPKPRLELIHSNGLQYAVVCSGRQQVNAAL